MPDQTPATSAPWQPLAKYGAWTLLVFYLLGAIPGTRSPFDRTIDATSTAIASAIAAHNRDMLDGQKELVSVLRTICQRQFPARPGSPDCPR